MFRRAWKDIQNHLYFEPPKPDQPGHRKVLLFKALPKWHKHFQNNNHRGSQYRDVIAENKRKKLCGPMAFSLLLRLASLGECLTKPRRLLPRPTLLKRHLTGEGMYFPHFLNSVNSAVLFYKPQW